VVLGVEIFSLQQYLREETVLNRKETSAAAPELTQETDSQPE